MSEKEGADGADINVLNFVGKTIMELDVSSPDYVVFRFDDGTSAALEVVSSGPLHNISEADVAPKKTRKVSRQRVTDVSTETI